MKNSTKFIPEHISFKVEILENNISFQIWNDEVLIFDIKINDSFDPYRTRPIMCIGGAVYGYFNDADLSEKVIYFLEKNIDPKLV